ncbi:RING finger protein 212B-like [Conger conger]|uniref:RING finger protein 212B-like n=1 Tax=Conger conger TaxID=82655 RepID=UPI002A59CE83|nr:RING finger protein 212B-like [Conger conger]
MDWLHCNFCFLLDGRNLAISSCGHITCERCVNPEHCNICGAICSYLPISDKMKPQEQLYFKDPLKLLQSRMEHISQIAVFQRRQKDRTISFFRHKALELERRLKEIMEQSYRELSELKQENVELKKPLSQRRASPGQFQSNQQPIQTQKPGTMCPDSAPLSVTQTPSSAFSSLSSLHDPRQSLRPPTSSSLDRR